MLQKHLDARGMQVHSTKAAQVRASVNYSERSRYEMGGSSTMETYHGGSCV